MLNDGADGAVLDQVLVTAHKGVDLHAATARRVMRERLAGGEALADLRRCEFHAFGSGPGAPRLADLLATGRYYNPNKHRCGHFTLTTPFPRSAGADGEFPAGWPGSHESGDGSAALGDLLGGPAAAGLVAVDVAAWVRGQDGPVVSGTIWRLVVRGEGATALATARLLAVARGGREGLLVNPHMECWVLAAGA